MAEIIPLTSTKPYLIRAFYDWIVDNECTPYVIVLANYPAVNVPNEYVENDQIILNIATQAINNLQMTNEFIAFEARFSGIVREIYLPVEAVKAIYAHENGRGMIFADEELPADEEDLLLEDKQLPEEEQFEKESTIKKTADKKLSLVTNPSNKEHSSSEKPPHSPPPPRPIFKGKPNLKIVK